MTSTLCPVSYPKDDMVEDSRASRRARRGMKGWYQKGQRGQPLTSDKPRSILSISFASNLSVSIFAFNLATI